MTDIHLSAPAKLSTRHGVFRCRAVRAVDGVEHAILFVGDVEGARGLPVRIHSGCLTGEALHSLHCDCGQQLSAALDHFVSVGRGLLIYLQQEGRGIGLFNKIEAYALQEDGYDTVEANKALGFPSDARSYGVAVAVLRQLGIKSVRLLTNNPRKIEALVEVGIEVEARIPVVIPANGVSVRYLGDKKRKMGHML